MIYVILKLRTFHLLTFFVNLNFKMNDFLFAKLNFIDFKLIMRHVEALLRTIVK